MSNEYKEYAITSDRGVFEKYDAKSPEDALKQFMADYPDARYIQVYELCLEY